MKVRLLRDARINHKAGEIVEVSPTEYGFLTSIGSAVPVSAQKSAEVKAESKAETKEPKKTAKKK